MITIFGYLTLALAFLLAVYGLIAVISGLIQKSYAWTESARWALLLIFPLVTISLVTLMVLLLNNRFDVAYVYSVTSRDMPGYLKLTALWGGQSGSLLFWSWLLAGFSMVFSLRKWREDIDLLPWVMVVVFISLGFFLALNVFMEVPFERFWQFPDGSRVLSIFQPAGAWSLMPQDGLGLNPLLRHPGMIWHPPALYLGFVGFIIPFALAIATLAVNRQDRRWLEISQQWVLITWVFLSLGLVLGMRWAYDVLGWGGYWGWDPVEIAALMPWLSATAFLHTAMLGKRKNSFNRWNLFLIILTFILVIVGTFLTRSGVLSSVHAFSGSEIGPPFFVFTAIITLGAFGLMVYRWQDFSSAHQPEFKFSRETLTLFTNLVLMSILMVCFLGVIYPIISELLTDTQITVGPAWYERINGPLFILLLLLMGICPLAAVSGKYLFQLRKRILVLLPLSLIVPLSFWVFANVGNILVLVVLWIAGLAGLVLVADFVQGVADAFRRESSGLFLALWVPLKRNHRKFGGSLVHFGIVLMSVGIIGIEGLQQETQATLAIGESAVIDTYTFKFEEIQQHSSGDDRIVTEAVLTITQDGKPRGALYPQREIYPNMGMAITHPGLKSTLAVDLYAILMDWRPAAQDVAIFRIYVNPLVNWLWIGTGVLTFGTIVAVWPDKRRSLSPAI